jgi:oxalate decarboxylase/phosphoglucose isomerase-like protein (cupin superfamily)
MVFIPGNARHQIVNVDEEELLLLYAFAAGEFQKIVYRF